jgi:glycosyltransferase involved in cell wall biosynthesis
MKPRVSVITITYNADRPLKKTIESIINQSNKEFEYLIVDGDSSDGTMAIVRDFESRVSEGEFGISPEQFRWISEPDEGLYDAMNKAINLAKSDFVWFINAGDKIYSPETLQQVVDAIDQNPDADVFYGQSIIIGQNDEILGERHRIAPVKLTKKSLLDGLVVCHQSVIVRRNIAPQYDLQYRLTADYDWMCRVLDASRKNVYIDGYLSKFQTAGLSSQRRKQSLKERFVIMKRHFGLLPTLWSHLRILLKYPFVTRKHVY